MREIKFRAYDKLEKRMCKVVSLHWQDDKLVAVKVDGEAEPLPIEGRFVIEQYTGLADKNGVDIAVGDIVAVNVWSGEEYTPEVGVVKYDLSSSGFKWYSDAYYWLRVADYEGREVIGNTHENPELMEERI